jgi:hypothetical protein
MNVLLSVNARNEKSGYVYGYVIKKQGKTVAEHTSIRTDKGRASLKTLQLEEIINGLAKLRGLVEHEDVLTIEIENRWVYEWLELEREQQKYIKYIDKVFGILDTLDCKYRFLHNETPQVNLLLDRGVQKEKVKLLSSIEMMEGLL